MSCARLHVHASLGEILLILVVGAILVLWLMANQRGRRPW